METGGGGTVAAAVAVGVAAGDGDLDAAVEGCAVAEGDSGATSGSATCPGFVAGTDVVASGPSVCGGDAGAVLAKAAALTKNQTLKSAMALRAANHPRAAARHSQCNNDVTTPPALLGPLPSARGLQFSLAHQGLGAC